MKQSFFTLILVILLTSCNVSKKVATTTTSDAVTETIKEVPSTSEREAPEVETDIIEKPETPEVPNIPEPAPVEIVQPEPPRDESPSIEQVVEENTAPTLVYPDHLSFGQLLATHVSPQGNVNYAGFKSNWSTLRAYIVDLGEKMPEDGWSKEDKLAYWMNAYNAMTIDLILRNQPLESIKDIKDPWDQRLWKLGNKWYNLNQIEHQILRKMGDARIHFGINCASFSCPPLLNEAFTAKQVDAQLDKLSRQFINDTKRNTITANSIEVSKIFTWFAKDFKTNGSLIDFLNKYSETPIASNAKKRYKDYDWTLNK